jgi:hypothetical protein
VKFGRSAEWQISHGAARRIPAGVHDVVVTRAAGEPVAVDWISFR